jgi:hypothetical protein
MVFWLAYLILCVIAGYLGRDSRLGFWGVTAASLFVTPVLTLLFVILFGRSSQHEAKHL